MSTLEIIYPGDLRTEIIHTQSGTKITTDAPVDNNGKGRFISPTDMVAGALGSCMLTMMDMAAKRYGVDLRGTRVEVVKIMASEPRRIVEIKINFYLPEDYSDRVKKILERAAGTCPVSKSLRANLIQDVTYHYGK